nr:hypothetical protein DGKKSRWO_DGKKSRWO_CDS_0019 [uncultured phage]CAI9752134.1 hypothetical protein CVNMHQAP_CVNMHQAP_CDS_0019 [uncultured phage]
MYKKFRPKSPIMFPVNVRILQKSSSGTLITETAVKNRVLKTYGLYSWVHFILGSFKNGSLLDSKQYVPKYLAVGSNEGELTGAPGTTTAVKVSDVSLYHELNDTTTTGEIKNRIKLNRSNYISDNGEDPYVKIQFEAFIPEDRFVGKRIGEMALMTGESGWNAFARITGFEPFTKVPNSVVQVIWEITVVSVESTSRFVPPVKTYLREAIEKAINVLQVDTTDPNGLTGAREALDKLIEPATVSNTGLWYLLNENEQITQESINNYLSKPFVSVTNTGLIPLINKFKSGEDWSPSGAISE